MTIYKDIIGESLNLVPITYYFPEYKDRKLPDDAILTRGGSTIETNGWRGQKHTEETLKKLRKPKSSTKNYFKPKSESHRKNISEAQKGVQWSETHRKNATGECIYCGIVATKTNIARWHNEKCKHKS